MNTEQYVGICKALSDPNRLEIMMQLSKGELCACNLLENLSITQPTLSHHMKMLEGAGLVVGRKDGKWTHFSPNRVALESFSDFIASLSNESTATEEGACTCR